MFPEPSLPSRVGPSSLLDSVPGVPEWGIWEPCLRDLSLLEFQGHSCPSFSRRISPAGQGWMQAAAGQASVPRSPQSPLCPQEPSVCPVGHGAWWPQGVKTAPGPVSSTLLFLLTSMSFSLHLRRVGTEALDLPPTWSLILTQEQTHVLRTGCSTWALAAQPALRRPAGPGGPTGPGQNHHLL